VKVKAIRKKGEEMEGPLSLKTEEIPKMDTKTKKHDKRHARLAMRAMLEADPTGRTYFKVEPGGRIIRLDPPQLGDGRLTPSAGPAGDKNPASPAPLTAEQQCFLRKVARDRRTLPQIIADAALLAGTLDQQGTVVDAEVRLGLARSRDLLVLVAAAMAPKDHEELLAKHEALAGVQPLDRAFGDLTSVVNAALSADWRRFDDAKRGTFYIGQGDRFH
jgi:hypothetical protein